MSIWIYPYNGCILIDKGKGNEEFIKAILFIVTIECSGIC